MALTLRERLRGSYCFRCDGRATYLVSTGERLLVAACTAHLATAHGHWVEQFGEASVEPLADLDEEWQLTDESAAG